ARSVGGRGTSAARESGAGRDQRAPRGGEAWARAETGQVGGGVGTGASADRRIRADGRSSGRAVSAARGSEGGRKQATGASGRASGSAARAAAARRSGGGGATACLSALWRSGARPLAAHPIHRGAAARAAGRDAADDVEGNLSAVRRGAQHASAASLSGARSRRCALRSAGHRLG